MAPQCDTFSLSGIDSTERLGIVACFGDWQPPVKDRALVRTEWDTPAAGRKRLEEEHTRFPIDVQTIARLMQPEYRDWFVSSEEYPSDQLFFFSGPELILEAEPYELGVLFYNLSSGRRNLLWHIEAEAFRALDFSRNWLATTLNISKVSGR